MKLTLYQIDAFADKLFTGNPAAVIPLDHWIDESLMQKIAMENNLAETVFFVPLAPSETEADYHIRWFTPAAEINLCGHATLASAYVLFDAHSQLIPFWSEKLGRTTMQAKQLSQRGGHLWCEQKGERVMMGGNCVFYMKGEVTEEIDF